MEIGSSLIEIVDWLDGRIMRPFVFDMVSDDEIILFNKKMFQNYNKLENN